MNSATIDETLGRLLSCIQKGDLPGAEQELAALDRAREEGSVTVSSRTPELVRAVGLALDVEREATRQALGQTKRKRVTLKAYGGSLKPPARRGRSV